MICFPRGVPQKSWGTTGAHRFVHAQQSSFFTSRRTAGQIGTPGSLRELITASFDAAAADAWSKFTVGEAEKLVLHEAALKVLKAFPGRMPANALL
jgi:hypothetical protein